MDKNKVLQTIKNVREISKKRNFDQTFDLIINFKDLDLKKNNLDVFLTLPHPKGEAKVCAFVGKELEKKAKEGCDEVVVDEDFKKYSDKKLIKKLAKNYDFFIAQANLMGQIATVFGRILGPLGKMPNPRLGAVLPPTIPSIQPIVDKFRKSVRLMTKKEPIIKTAIGKENMKDEEIYENFNSVYEHIIHDLPKAEHNVKNVLIKMTMSKPVEIGKKVQKEEVEEEPKKVVEKKEKPKVEIKEKIKIEDKEETISKKDFEILYNIEYMTYSDSEKLSKQVGISEKGAESKLKDFEKRGLIKIEYKEGKIYSSKLTEKGKEIWNNKKYIKWKEELGY